MGKELKRVPINFEWVLKTPKFWYIHKKFLTLYHEIKQ